MDGLHILISGAGIAGLSLLQQLGKQNHQLTLIEKSPQLSNSGTGIMLGINAIEILNELGLTEQIREKGQELNRFAITDQKGKTLNLMRISRKRCQNHMTMVAIHRQHLHEILAENLKHSSIRFNTSISRIQQSEHCVDISFNDNSSHRYDLVLGADGIYSNTRQLIWPQAQLRYSGYTCWRFIIPRIASDNAMEMWGKGKRLGIVPINSQLSYVFLVINAEEGKVSTDSFDCHYIRSIFGEFGGQAPSVLERLEQRQNLVHNDLYDLPKPLLGSNRVFLLGDAAHAATPNLGQGASMAIEDSYVLSNIIRRENNLHQFAEHYVGARLKRVKRMLDMSYNIGRIAQWESPVAVMTRNSLMRLMPSRLNTKQTEKFLLNYRDYV